MSFGPAQGAIDKTNRLCLKAGPSGYLIEPKILHWEDRATEWSGKADRVKVSLQLYRSGSLIGSALVKAKASLAGKANPNQSVTER